MNMASKIQVSCPNCNAVLEAEEEWQGMRLPCPNCNHVFEISNTTQSEQSVQKDPQKGHCKTLEDKRAELLEEKRRQLELKEKRRKIDRFFNNAMSPVKMKVAGILLIIVGIPFSAIIVGIPLVILGVFLLWLSSKPVIDEAEFDLYAEEDMAYIDSLNILEQYGKDESELVSKVYTKFAPDFEGAGLVDFAWRLGEDGKIRYSIIEVTKAFMFQDQLMIFTASWDFIKGILMNETTYTFFYKDIVAINTSSVYDKTSNAWFIQLVGMIPYVGEYIAAFMKEKATIYKTAETFDLISSSGNSIGLGVGFDQWVLAHGGQVPDKTDAEEMIRAIRKMVEEKKTS